MDERMDRYDASLSKRIEEARSKIKLQQRVKGAEPVYRLEVPFDDKEYLKKLGEEAIAYGLVTGFTIDTVETTFRWNGSVREGVNFVLRTTVPDVGRTKLRRLYQFFYDGIGEMWLVPVVYIDSTISTNKEFVEWMKRQSKETPVIVEEPENPDRWKYVRGTHYINLFDTVEDEVGEYQEVHVLTILAPRRHGIIDVEQTKAFFHSPIKDIEARTDLYGAIQKTRGLSRVDRETLERGKRALSLLISEEEL